MKHNSAKTKPIESWQRRRIFGLLGEAGMKENREDILFAQFNKNSITELTFDEANSLIDFLKPKTGVEVSPNASAVTSCAGPGVSTALPRNIITQTEKQLHVLSELFLFLDYNEAAQKTFMKKIDPNPFPLKTAKGIEKVIFALLVQAAPKMLKLINAPSFVRRLTVFEKGFMFYNRADLDEYGRKIKGTWNAVQLELEQFIEHKNRRGRRTMPRFSLTVFFEILHKRRGNQ